MRGAGDGDGAGAAEGDREGPVHQRVHRDAAGGAVRGGPGQNSLVTGLARHGAEISPATLAGTAAQAGGLLAPLEEAIAARNRESWHLPRGRDVVAGVLPRRGDRPREVLAVGLRRGGHRVRS